MNFNELKYIAEYPRYAATKDGTIYSFHSNKFLKLVKKPNGYMVVSLSNQGKVRQILVHRIIASLFCNKPQDCNQVNHMDGDKTNNHSFNLEWVTAKQNNDHALSTGLKTPGFIGEGEDNPSHKLTEIQVERIIDLRLDGFSNKRISDLLKINSNTVNGILSGQTWHHVSKRLGYTPKNGFKRHL